MTPRIVIAGTQSGAGKTTIASGIMAALTARGLKVQGIKAGPDYIDPQCHRWATGRPGRNLDTWLMTSEQVRTGFVRHATGVDLVVIEGVMGLYDGATGNSDLGSTAYLAKMLGAPVILVLDARASARSAAAVALGFKMFDPKVRLAGVICNRVGSDRHAQMLREGLEGIGIPMVGAVLRDSRLNVPEDRLGLALPGGEGGLPQWIARAGDVMEEQVDLDLLLELAGGADSDPGVTLAYEAAPTDPFNPAQAGRFADLRLAVGLDPAFWFYYEDTFEMLRHWGVELIFFSPLADRSLPCGVHGLYLGGGFPERHAAALSANEAMRVGIREAWSAQLPMLAECGGYLYLLEGLEGEDGQVHPMTAAIPGRALLQSRLQGMGYRTAEPGGVKGHVFHYTRVEGAQGPPAWNLTRSNGEWERVDGSKQGAVLASYLHVHHATQPYVMADFLVTCQQYKEAQTDG